MISNAELLREQRALLFAEFTAKIYAGIIAGRKDFGRAANDTAMIHARDAAMTVVDRYYEDLK